MPVFATSRLGTVIVGSEKKASNAVFKTVKDIETDAKDYAAVDTGNMRASTRGRMTGSLSGRVTVAAEYAPYVEFGTRHQAAQPFMIPAAEANRESFEQAMKDVFS